jgi:hypothetical protein
MEKTCIACGQTKPAEQFYRHPAMSGGRLNKCRDCCCRAAKANRDSRLEHYRKYDQERLSTEGRKEQLRQRQKAYRARNKEKHEARMAVFRAIRSGAMTRQACEICGNFPADAHHDDYATPLAVRWLCRKHHLIEHGNYVEQPSGVEVAS